MYEYLFPKQCTIAKNGQNADRIDRKQGNHSDRIAATRIFS